jgi:hypothetical protein
VPDVEEALSQIAEIRAQMAAGTRFLGFAPQAVALTGILAVGTSTAQALWPEPLADTTEHYLLSWIVAAVLAVTVVGTEALTRSREHHGALSDTMINSTLRQLVPFGAAGAILGFVLFKVAPDVLWVLPGFWQMLVALAAIASLPSQPRGIAWVGAWYFVSGTVVLLLAGQGQLLTPWMMGVPFAVGQMLAALILHRANVASHG